MNPVLLITKLDFAPYVEISGNLSTQKLNTYIEHAQEFDLRPLLGDLLFYDLLGNVTDEKYVDLIAGKEYQVDGVNIPFKGLVPVIVHFAASRLVSLGNSMITATGMKDKLNEFSNPTDPREISRISNTFESLALGYWQKSKSFLDTHSGSYPLWDKSTCKDAGNRRISCAKIYGLN